MDHPPGTVEPLMDFATLYRDHARDVHRFALYLSGDPALAEDLASEAFVRVSIARERVALATVRGYLFAIVRNLYLQEMNQRSRHVPLDDRLAPDRPGADDRAEMQSSLRAVLAALAALRHVDRAAVLMRADDGLPYDRLRGCSGSRWRQRK